MIVGVISQKGGVSKSTIATNLAAAAHLAGHRAVVVDLDKQATAQDWHDSRDAESPLAGLEVVRPERRQEGSWIVGWLLQLGREHDYVVVDCPGDLCPLLEYAAAAADVVVMPARPGMADIWAMRETINTKITAAEKRREEEGRAPAPRLVVVTQAVDGTRNKREALDELEKYGEVLEDAVLHHRQVYTDALSMGESVLTLDPEGAASEEVKALYRATMKAATMKARRKA